MSEIITAQITGNRGNPPTLQTIVASTRIRLDKKDMREASYYEGADPHFTYDAIVEYLSIANPTLLQVNDTIIDQHTVEVVGPLAGQLRRYRIISEPEPFPNGHWEFAVNRYRGK